MLGKIKTWFYNFCLNGESFTSSFADWWFLVKNGQYEGIEPYGQQVFFSYLGRTLADGERAYSEFFNYED